MITLDQYVINTIHNFPTLYSSASYKEAKMKVLNHILNVIGNGIRDNEELAEELNISTSATLNDIVKYVSGQKMYYGYTKVNTYKYTDDHIFYSPDSSGKTYYGVMESEKDQYPDVVYWMECSYNKPKPYPNFNENYSLVYTCSDFFNLHPSFIQGAIEFYEYVKEWFIDNESRYNYAFPAETEQKTNKRVLEFKSYITKYNTFDEVTQAYGGIEFTGDVYQFLIDKWTKEKTRIFDFIEKILTLLKKNVDSTNEK